MATYKEIIGTHIKSVSSDPPNPENGQMWYNTTTRVVKGFKSNPVGSWSTSTALNTGRFSAAGSPAGTQTASLLAGGQVNPGANVQNATESWNGSTWTELNNLNTARYDLGSAGSYTSSLAFGGEKPGGVVGINESWNGSAWTEVADLNNNSQQPGGVGASNSSALRFGGNGPTGPGPVRAYTESWNGTSWTEVNDLNDARAYPGGAGTATAALAFGGSDFPGTTANTESWNGTCWSEVNNLNTSKEGMRGAGTNTAALSSGQSASPRALTEQWDGTSWTEVNDLNTGRAAARSCGSTSSAIYYSGTQTGPQNMTDTEEFTAPTTSTVTFTVS